MPPAPEAPSVPPDTLVEGRRAFAFSPGVVTVRFMAAKPPVIVTARKLWRKPPRAPTEAMPAMSRIARKAPSTGEADITAEEHQRYGDGADEPFRELVRQATGD